MIVERIKAGLKKRKVKLFLIFLFFSFLAWFINNLSRTFVSTASFNLEYVGTPKNLLLASPPKSSVNVRLRAVGFQFVGFGIRKKSIQIDLSEVKKKDSIYYIAPSVYKKQIERQLSGDMTLLDVDNDTIFVDFTKVVTKTVPVLPRINLSLAKNYEIEDSLSIEPRMVKITGPKSQIDSIRNVRTSFFELLDVDEDFSVKRTLVKPRELDKTIFDPVSVTISAKVYRFSEKVYNVPVTILNVPNDVKVRMFPDVIKVVCQAKLEQLKEIDADDFLITADYAQVTGSSQNIIPVNLSKKPKGISNAILSTQEIEFILRRE